MSCAREGNSVFSSFFLTRGKRLEKLSRVIDVTPLDSLIERARFAWL